MKPYHALLYSPRLVTRSFFPNPLRTFIRISQSRHQSTLPAATPVSRQQDAETIKRKPPLPAMSVMPTPLLLRSLMITSILASPRLLNMLLPIMHKMSFTNSWLANPDKNPLLHTIIRKFFYDHFAAGENDVQVRETIAAMKSMGFQGVILGYGKEAVTGHSDGSLANKSAANISAIEQWRDGNLQTLNMLDAGDFLAIKFTGAGDAVVNALISNTEPPAAFRSSMEQIVSTACMKNTRVWIDAEQQAYQGTIDAWTIDLMRKYNTKESCTNDGPPIYTTMQAYLKSTPSRIAEHIKLAHAENWTLGIKLVRGAYLASEQRDLIYDTKADTDAAYNGIVKGLLTKTVAGIQKDEYPSIKLFVASHNEASVERAYALEKKMILNNIETIGLEFGQLQGMSDELSCSLVRMAKDLEEDYLEDSLKRKLKPKVFKCLCWGSVQQCMQFLVRRAVENKAAVERTREWQAGLRNEVLRRMWSVFGR